MATIPSNVRTASETLVNKLDLDAGPHSFAFSSKNQQTLNVDNGEVGSLTVNLSGDGVATFACKGMEDQNTSAGFDFIIPAGEQRPLVLTERAGYLGNTANNVVVTVTGATGLSFAWLTTE